jgi:hypothetical protein
VEINFIEGDLMKDYVSDHIRVENINVYGLENSIRVSKFPKAIDTHVLTEDMTKIQPILGGCKTGTGHDCFLKGIVVQFDLTLPQYILQQIKRYKFFDIVSSQSTMHKIMEMDIEHNCTPETDKESIKILRRYIEEYKKETDEVWKKEAFRRAIANIPSGLMLTLGISTNYLQLKTIRQQRKGHPLDEWRELTSVIDELPRFKELVLGEQK